MHTSHHFTRARLTRRTTRARIPLVLALSLASLASWAADDAQVVMVVGKVEVQSNAQGAWRQVAVNQKLSAGDAVRTGEASQMALVASDQTQVRLNQQSLFKLKSVGNQEGGTALELQQGRMWAQAKQFFTGLFRRTTSLVNNQASRRLQVTTPTSTIGIRGTDWEVSVGDAGTTQVAVFSGEVEVGNELGQVLVAPNEQATVRAGQAPVKVLLSNAKDRVQWVTAYRPTPRRWVPNPSADVAASVKAIEAGDYAGALAGLKPRAATSPQAALLLADMDLFLGQADDAIALLASATRGGAGDPAATALTARALTVAGRMDEAGKLLAAGLAQHPGDRELLLARADLARLQGDGPAALDLFAKVAATDANSHEAWFGIGRIENEKENVVPAKAALDKAIALAPQAPGYHGELATLQTLTSDLPAARASFEEALKQQPDDYLAWTGLGILQLKAGQPQQALESFLKAGVIEPRFARAQLYTAVAYYQLGNYGRALETVKKAAEQDPKDPLPHVMLGLMQGDALDLGAAVEAARQAQARMPYLKSLNPIANDQKGSANLGSALANFGAEEWASYYAAKAYTPYWAGSHLFLADRYIGKFNKNSELFAGFLADPTVFGASNRDSSLVTVPGVYGRVDLALESNDWRQAMAGVTINGLSVNPIPVSYFVSGTAEHGDSRQDSSSANLGNLVLGLGLKPSYNTSLFAFATDSRSKGTLRTPELTDNPLDQQDKRVDIGLNYKLAFDNQIWLKVGTGSQYNNVGGSFYSPATAAALNAKLSTNSIQPYAQFTPLQFGETQDDVQFKHAFSANGIDWSWGLEHSRQTQKSDFNINFTLVQLNNAQPFSGTQDDAYASARFKFASGNRAQVDLYAQHSEVRRESNQSVDILVGSKQNVPVTADVAAQNTSELNARLGYEWALAPAQSLRAVLQKWRHPMSAASLASPDTLGVAVNDQLVAAGGLYQRARLQYDGEFGNGVFLQAFLDRELMDNGPAGLHNNISDFQLEKLVNLRNGTGIFAPKPDLEESPSYPQGAITTLGLAANAMLGKNQMLSARYLYRDNRQTGDYADLLIPYVPKHYLLLASQWSLPERWQLGASATYRSMRYTDDFNTDLLKSGWSFGLSAYWETMDKRSAVQLILDNLLSDSKAGEQSQAHLLVKYIGRF